MPLERDHDQGTICPVCRAMHEAAANLTGDERPNGGDYSMCIMCGGWSVFDFSVRGNLRFMTDDETAVWQADPNMQSATIAYKLLIELKGRPTAERGYDHG